MATSTDVPKSKIVGAIIGALTADAACMGLHWIYSQAKVEELLASGGADPLFFSPPSCPYYEYEQGESTPYGAQAQPFVTAVAAAGDLDPAVAHTEYSKWAAAYAGRKNGSVKAFEENVAAGKLYPDAAPDNKDFDSVMKGVLGACVYAGKPEMLEKVEAFVRVSQNNDLAVQYGQLTAKIVEHVLLGATIPETLEWVAANGLDSSFVTMLLNGVIGTASRVSHSDAVSLIGPTCSLPDGFLGACHSVAGSPADLLAALRSTVKAGGDSATRSMFVGALLGASGGIESVPEDLIGKCGPWMPSMRSAADTIAEKFGV